MHKLDLGCGKNKAPGFWGLDKIKYPGVDVVWDFNQYPWPFENEFFWEIRAHHVIEHIPRVMIDEGGTWWPFMSFMNEAWRVLAHAGQFHIWYPPGGTPSYYQDLTHVNPCNKTTWEYFDPDFSNGFLYNCYNPRPWHILDRSTDSLGNDVIVLERL